MSEATMKKTRKVEPLNGVDTPALFATLDAVKAQRELAKFQFRASNRWQQGTLSRTTFESFYGAGSEQMHKETFTYDADHPEVLVGAGMAPTPVEFLLHGLAGCLTAGIGNIAAARGVTLYEVESTVEADANLLGLLGIDETVRNGYEQIRISFKIRGNAPAEKLRAIVEQSRNRSAVYDVLTNGTPVSIEVDAE